MARRCLRTEEVLQAVLASDSESESEFGSGDSDTENVDDDDRALRDLEAVVDSVNINDSEDMAVDDDDDDVPNASDWVCPTFDWHPAAGDMPVLYPFSGENGIKVGVDGFSPAQFYQLFVSPELIHHFVVQTNIFASQYIQSHPQVGPHSRVRRWVDTNEEEMKKFIGLVFLMGIIHKPTLSMYWSSDVMYATPLFSAIMPRNRFELLLKFFHLNDNTNEPDRQDPHRDRLFKLRPLVDHLFEHFQLAYTPGPSVAVDETLLLWKGRLHFRQYIPLKRARFGIKMFSLAEDSGYIYRFRIYAGKEDPMTSVSAVMPAECQNFGSSEKIVVYLALPLLNCGYTLWMDNWYSSCKLYHYLHCRKTTACGTIRANRVPIEVRNPRLATGELCAYRSGPLLCMKFRDKKDIFMLTTQHTEAMDDAPRRRGRPTTTDVRRKPQCIIDYNRNMGGVDKQDQMLEPYSAARKSMKWYKKLSFHLLQLAMLNSHILYQKSGGKKTFVQFEHDVIASFLFPGMEPHVDKLESVVRLTERHFPSVLQPTPTWTKPQARCKVCSKKGRRRDVKTFCAECPSKPGLCVSPCFGDWHTKDRYWD